MSLPLVPRLLTPIRGALAFGMAALVAGTASTLRAGKLSFNDTIQPILSEHCFQCHGPDSASRKGELRLDRAEFAFLPRKEGGFAIAQGKPHESLIMKRITATKADQVMPPPEAHKPLKAGEVELLRRWIAEGAEYQEHWAFVKPQKEPLPSVQRPDWAGNAVDRFIFANLEKSGLTPMPEADKYALLRRVTFDLTGLPPTPTEIGDFLADSSPKAYERVVERLLASPRYGEHRARYWLDAVRYGDTNGEHADNLRTTWPYRDYVIRSFNENKPFDKFVMEQLAGDLMAPENTDQLVATAFNRLHTTTNEGGSVVEEIYLHKLKDRTLTTAGVFLGLTMGCAACHDHKFDPITQKDFYGLSGFFNNMPDSVYDANQSSSFPTMNVPTPEKRAAADQALAAKSAVERRLAERRAKVPELLGAWLAAGGLAKLHPVSTENLVARFRLDEKEGSIVRDSAPGAKQVDYTLAGNDQSWGGCTRPVKLWTGLRFGVQTALKAPGVGDFERDQAFSVGGWFLPRERSGTTSGAFVSRMATSDGRGWEIYWQNAGARRPAADKNAPKKPKAERKADTEKVAAVKKPAAAKPAGAKQADEDVETRPEPEGYFVVNLANREKENAISVRAKKTVSRKEWVHLAFTYDGSGKAAGVQLFIDGMPQEIEIVSDTLTESMRTEAPFQLARRTGGEASPETAFQDIRIYTRALAADEVKSMTIEDIACEVLQRPMASWSLDERKIATDFYLTTIDSEAIALRTELAKLDTEFQRASAGGLPLSISRERESRAVGFVLNRGSYDSIKERVDASVPAVLPPLPPGAPRNRLGFAQWLVSRENPLTARVLVNRMWQEVFGMGIVETPENFGTVGAKPSNRPLLDWLAVDFEESGWNVKRLYRQMVMSAAYRQSAKITPEALEKDPKNALISRGPRFRLDAEMIRDQALCASGLLAEQVGGPSVRPYQAEGIWEAVSVANQSNTRDYVPDKGSGLYRRSIYTFWKRSAPNPVLATFDAPKRDVCTLRRDRTNTPLQALVVENAPDYLEAARTLATQALHTADTSARQKLDWLSLQLLNRPLAARQEATLTRSLETFRQNFTEEDAKSFLAVGDSPVDDSLPPTELAAWTLLASQLLNSDYALNK